MDLICRLAAVGGRAVLHASGEIDLATLPLFRDQLVRAIGQNAGQLITVDLDGVTALDDTGLGILLGAAARARELGGDLDVVCTNERLLARLGVTGFDRAVAVRSGLA